MVNPYESPEAITPQPGAVARINPLGRVGFLFSSAGLLAHVLLGWVPFDSTPGLLCAFAAFAAFPGLVISLVALFRAPRRIAGGGVAVGLFGCMYLPTMWIALASRFS